MKKNLNIFEFAIFGDRLFTRTRPGLAFPPDAVRGPKDPVAGTRWSFISFFDAFASEARDAMMFTIYPNEMLFGGP